MSYKLCHNSSYRFSVFELSMYFYNVLCFDTAYGLLFSKLVKQSDKILDISINLKVLNIYRTENMTTVL